MRNEKLKIDAERGVAHVYGEEKRLATEVRREDKGRWFVYSDRLLPDVKYDVLLENQRGEVVGIWFGYYRPSMLALDIYPVWSAPGKRFGRLKIAERMVKLRRRV